jgi:hypothetical protein
MLPAVSWRQSELEGETAMRKIVGAVVALYILAGAAPALGQPQGVTITDLVMPDWRWGNQPIKVEITNNDSELKFVVIWVELRFMHKGREMYRTSRYSFHMEPEVHLEVEPVVSIPGNYGKGSMRFQFFDVVDTVDAVLPDQQFFDTSFTVEIKAPDAIIPWLERPIVLPPRVDEHPYYADQFSRILFSLIADGKSEQEIAEIAGTGLGYVRSRIQEVMGLRYIRSVDNAYELAFPLISLGEAGRAKVLALRTAETMASAISVNMGRYVAVRDSLIQVGFIGADSGNVLSPAEVFFRPYPVVAALLLWYDLGSRFIVGEAPFLIYEGTDVCNAYIRSYMYAAPEQDQFNGHHFYALLRGSKISRLIFADHYPLLHCSGNFPAQRGNPAKANWANDQNDWPDYGLLDTLLARPLLDALGTGIDDVLRQTSADLETVAAEFGRKEVTRGYRYWFWNLTATLTLDMLTEREVIKSDGKTHFLFSTLE